MFLVPTLLAFLMLFAAWIRQVRCEDPFRTILTFFVLFYFAMLIIAEPFVLLYDLKAWNRAIAMGIPVLLMIGEYLRERNRMATVASTILGCTIIAMVSFNCWSQNLQYGFLLKIRD